jgi:Uma2 family endonuclease
MVTFEEFESFLAYPENSDRLFELINGEIVEKVYTQEQGVITANIATDFRNYSRRNKFGRVGVEVLHHKTSDMYNARQPNISFYVDTIEPIVKVGPMKRMPDLAVEIESRSDNFKQLQEKIRYFLANGTQIVWLAILSKRQILAFTSDHTVLHTIDDTISGQSVLPGFTLKVRDAFED